MYLNTYTYLNILICVYPIMVTVKSYLHVLLYSHINKIELKSIELHEIRLIIQGYITDPWHHIITSMTKKNNYQHDFNLQKNYINLVHYITTLTVKSSDIGIRI